MNSRLCVIVCAWKWGRPQQTEREDIREATLEGLNTAARKGNPAGRPPVITDDMLHTVLRRRGER